MSRNDRRTTINSSKKDQTVQREVLTDLSESTDRSEVGNAGSQYRHGNRDQARGDWDRSRRMDDSE